MRFLYLLFLLCFLFFSSSAQVVFEHVDNRGIYDFLDELANDGFIEINSVVKPYSRDYIAVKLKEADEQKELLNNIQRKTLSFYLKDYNKELKASKYSPKKIDLLYYKDSLFSFTINPILGFEYNTNQNGEYYKRYNGADFFGYIGKNFGFYASLRDNFENTPSAKPEYFTLTRGGKYKGGVAKGESVKGAVDYSEMRGGLTFAWNWGSFSLLKDHIQWGNNYNGANIISDKTPSFPLIKLNIKPAKWIELNYVHTWLVSEELDSSRSYIFNVDTSNNKVVYNRRDYFINKYLAANFVTITPFKKLNISIGNSVVYDGQIIPAYLIPIFFYKSVDHTLALKNSIGQNSQMFMDVSSRQIKHLHLYSSLFIDEIALTRMLDKEKHRNYYSLKAGFKLNNFVLKNYALTFEYTRTNPLTYQHFVPTTTYESNFYNLGYYLRDNSEDIYVKLDYALFYNLKLSVGAEYATVGKRHNYTEILGVSTSSGLKFLESVDWKKENIFFRVVYQPINDIVIYGEYYLRNISGDNYQLYTQDVFFSKTNNVNFGLNIKF